MVFLYQIGLFFYALGIRVASLFSPKAKEWIDGRKNWERNLLSFSETNGKDPWVWFHCASLGEFEQARPLIEKIRLKKKGYRILITFFSPSGFRVRKDYGQADCVCYLPLDTPRNAKNFLDIFRPEVAFFIRYEFWFFFLRELKKRGIKHYLVSASFTTHSTFFKPIVGNWYSKMLHSFSAIFVMDMDSKTLLENEKGVSRVEYSGDTRADRVLKIAEAPQDLQRIKNFKGDNKLLILGSAWKEDLGLIKNISFEGLRVLIAPHEIAESSLGPLLALIEKPFVRYSESNDSFSSKDEIQVLVLDTMGMLASAYSYADIAYVGGGFGKGIHNLLEPAAHGIPVLFGPKHQKFPEASGLLRVKGGVEVKEEKQFSRIIGNWLKDEKSRISVGNAAKSFVESAAGATDIIFDRVFSKT